MYLSGLAAEWNFTWGSWLFLVRKVLLQFLMGRRTVWILPGFALTITITVNNNCFFPHWTFISLQIIFYFNHSVHLPKLHLSGNINVWIWKTFQIVYQIRKINKYYHYFISDSLLIILFVFAFTEWRMIRVN